MLLKKRFFLTIKKNLLPDLNCLNLKGIDIDTMEDWILAKKFLKNEISKN